MSRSGRRLTLPGHDQGMTDAIAYRLHHPHGAVTYADGLNAAYDQGPASVPATWFIGGIGYVPADHPRCRYYLSGPFTAEPVDQIPQAYKDESARLARSPELPLHPPTSDAAA